MTQEPAAGALCAPLTLADLPLGTKVRFIPEVAPNAHRRFGNRSATVVVHNQPAGEVGLTYGWAGPRSQSAWRWSGDESLVWAAPHELTYL